MLANSVNYKETSRKRVKEVLRYFTSVSFVRDIAKASTASTPRWAMMLFSGAKPKGDTNFLGANAEGDKTFT